MADHPRGCNCTYSQLKFQTLWNCTIYGHKKLDELQFLRLNHSGSQEIPTFLNTLAWEFFNIKKQKCLFLLGLIQHTSCKGVYIPQGSKICLTVGTFLALTLVKLWYFSKHCTLPIANVRHQMVKFITMFL